jgi:hypothetical protein
VAFTNTFQSIIFQSGAGGELSKPKKILMAVIGLDFPSDLFVAGAIMVTSDERYFFELLDDNLNLPLLNHWALFGGQLEPKGELRVGTL